MVFLFVGVAAGQNDHWYGLYTFNEESIEPGRERTSNWVRLEVNEGDGNAFAILSKGVNGRTVSRLRLTVKTEGERALFFYDRVLPRVEGSKGVDTDREFVRGDLMFEFEERPRHCGTVIVTTWRKLDLAAQTETGGSDEGFFTRVF